MGIIYHADSNRVDVPVKIGMVFGEGTIALLVPVPTAPHYYYNILFIFLIALKVE